jgi:predicted AAA+ superfamily ATPase
MTERPFYTRQLSRAVRRSPITALIGPRQCGKTTLARMFAEGRNTIFFDLESQIDLNRLQNPQLMLGSLQNLVIIDEIQQMPELFRVSNANSAKLQKRRDR